MVRFLYVCQNKLKVKTLKQISTAVLLRLLVLASITMIREKEKNGVHEESDEYVGEKMGQYNGMDDEVVEIMGEEYEASIRQEQDKLINQSQLKRMF